MGVFFGDAGNNFIIGSQGNDQIYGLGGNDSLDGSGGNDMLFGNQQRDVLFGSFGDDSMYGGSDNDSLDGGIANDLLFGDSGNDTLRGNSGTDVLRGGSGADLFILDSEDSYPNFSLSQGDTTDPPLPFPFFFASNNYSNNISSNSSSENLLLTDSDSAEIPLYFEFKQVGEDLFIRTSWMEGEGYASFPGLGAEINNPLQFPEWFSFSSSEPYTGPFDSTSIEEADTYANYSYITAEESEQADQQLLDQLDLSIDPADPLYGLRVSEATLIQGIEQLDNGGSLTDLGWLGEGEATANDLRGALTDVQGYIADELTRQEEAAAEVDSLLLPEMPLVEKRVFFIEEGAAISAEFQEMTMGSEVFFLPEGYFPSEY
jgi:hypothetical protein